MTFISVLIHQRNKMRKVVALAVALLIGVTMSSCSSSSGSEATASLPPNSLGVLHVEHFSDPTQLPIIVDSSGRQVFLRGVALSGFEDQNYTGAKGTTPHYPIDPSDYNGKCPINNSTAPDPPVCEVQANLPWNEQSTNYNSENDLAQVRQDGFNVVRLTVNWSEIEPTEGHYSTTFLSRVAQVVTWASQQGISVILDMHEDGYSRFLNQVSKTKAPSGCTPSTGQDGAPKWAVFTDNQPSCSLYGQNELNPAMAAALTNFWDNKKVKIKGEAPGYGLQDHYIGAVAFLAKYFKNNPTVIGYELMNEPLPYGSGAIPIGNLFTFSDNYLFPFYQRIIEAITGVRDSKKTCPTNTPDGNSNVGISTCAYPNLGINTKKLIFLEPTGYNNEVDFAPQYSYDSATSNHLPPPLTSYSNIVFSPHQYTHVFTLDTFTKPTSFPKPVGYNQLAVDALSNYENEASTGTYPPSYDFAYQTAEGEAEALRAALLVTEYGDSPSNDNTILSGMIRAQLDANATGIFWTFKEDCGTIKQQCQNGWGIYASPKLGSNGTLEQNGPLRVSRLKIIGGPYPYRVDGSVQSMGYDPTSGNFVAVISTTHSAKVGDLNTETEIEIPSLFKSYQVAVVPLTQAAVSGGYINQPGGGRLLVVATKGSGTYAVEVVSPTNKAEISSLFSRVEVQSQEPLPVIYEPQARQILEDYLNYLDNSTSTNKVYYSILSALLNIAVGSPSNDPNLK